MRVAIRTDASNRIGSGHVIRCKTLADELRRHGVQILFICRDHQGNLIALLRAAGYSVAILRKPHMVNGSEAAESYAAALGVSQHQDAAETKNAISEFAPDWLVVDHYSLDHEWENFLRDSVGKIFVIDDLANRAHDCDLLLDQNWFGSVMRSRYDGLVPATCTRLLGPRYALIQAPYRYLRECLTPTDGHLRRILLFFGAVDSHDQTAAALRSLCIPSLSDIIVDVVIGYANQNHAGLALLADQRPGVHLYRQMPSLAGLMAKADLMLGAGGSTTWERCCLGLAGIVVSAAQNQLRFTRELAEEGVHFYLGPAVSVKETDWSAAIEGLRHTPDKIRFFSDSSRRFVDGLGAMRISALINQNVGLVCMRCAESSDDMLLFDWANDPDVRKYAFQKDFISLVTHRAWLNKKLADPNCLMLIGEDFHGLPVGLVRFDIKGCSATVDISVEPAIRGRGMGKRLLAEAISILRMRSDLRQVIAEVLHDNRSSCALFQQLGFEIDTSASGQDGSHRFLLNLDREIA